MSEKGVKGMPSIAFQTDAGSAEIYLDQRIHIRIVGGSISAGGPILALHANGSWYIGDKRITRITCQGPLFLDVHGEAGPQSFGPFEDLYLSDDVVGTTKGILARYGAQQEAWYFDRHGAQTEALVVRVATELLPATA